jgi:hypothetical protein
LTGLAAVSVGRDPNGIGGRIAAVAEKGRQLFGLERRPALANADLIDGTAAAVFLQEEGNLVSAGR